MYEITGATLKYFEKQKNGDNYCFEVHKIEKLIIAVVADGVSKQPCDWFASELLCAHFFTFFKAGNCLSLRDRIYNAITKTNDLILATKGKCENMRSTLSLFVWDYGVNDCFISNIGDSRIYKIRKGNLDQITMDDSIYGTTEIQTRTGKRIVQTSSLTNTIGATAIEIKIDKIDFEIGTTILLASDGFYFANKNTFENDMQKLNEAENFEEMFKEIFAEYDWSTRDDMTAIAIRNDSVI